MILRNGPGDMNGLILLAGYMHDDPASFVRSHQLFGGFVDQGFWSARPKDALAGMLSWMKVSNQLTNAQQFDAFLGLPFVNGATGVQTSEVILELSYQIHVTEGVTFMPDFQYVVRPNGQANIPNAVVLGFKSHIEF